MRLPGIGAIYVLPSGANPTPIPIAIVKDVSADIKVTKKGLNGQWKWPIDVAEFATGMTLKFGNADFRAGVVQMLQNQTVITTGQVLPATGEAWTIPTTPFQVTVSQSAFFVEDAGVLDYTAGKWLARVVSAPATGQYSVAAGVYTFAAADVAHKLSIVYSYSSTVGQTATIGNATMGASTPYAVRILNQYTINGAVKSLGLSFPAVHFNNMGWALKSEDWAAQSLEGMVAQDPASQNVCSIYVGD
jgi:hypothetical protein